MPTRIPRPQHLEGRTTKVRTGHGTMYVTVTWNPDTGLPLEVFAKMGKAGGCESAHLEALTRVVSICLQYSIPPADIIRQLRNVTCHPINVGGEGQNLSPADAIGLVLQSSYEEEVSEEPAGK